jgi:hypothetical protein
MDIGGKRRERRKSARYTSKASCSSIIISKPRRRKAIIKSALKLRAVAEERKTEEIKAQETHSFKKPLPSYKLPGVVAPMPRPTLFPVGVVRPCFVGEFGAWRLAMRDGGL